MAAQPASHDDAIRAVALYRNRPMPGHERASHEAVARSLAILHGVPFVGAVGPDTALSKDVAARARVYLVPASTLIAGDMPAAPVISDPSHFFGGVAPHPFVATKAITHPLIEPGAVAPIGWSVAFAERVAKATLPGYTAFSIADARRACERLLMLGPVRVKPVHATGGRGQSVITHPDRLADTFASIDPASLALCGLVLESHLENVTTFSVGQVTAAGVTATYFGTQCLTTANNGETVYGGSTLTVARGGFDDLLAMDIDPPSRRAIAQAQCYDQAASDCFAGFFASRRNYDVVAGRDAAGGKLGGVLEQSWRIGGASGAELAALLAFHRDLGLRYVRAMTVERYGGLHQPPSDADIVYRAIDGECGPMIKYVMCESV